MEKCGKCNNNTQGKEALKCVECNATFHQRCTRSVGDKVSTRSTWKCDGCVSENSSTGSRSSVDQRLTTHGANPVLDAIAALRREVTGQLKDVQSDLKKVTIDIDQMKNQMEDLKNQNQRTCESVEELRSKNVILTKTIKVLTSEVNNLQQHTRKNNMIITGIPITKGEDIYAILANIAALVNVQFNYADISIAHRLSGKKGNAQPPPIVVNFVSRQVKSHWIYARKQKRSLSARQLQEGFPDNIVYFNEHLTPQTRVILNAARGLLKEKKLAFVWTSDCKVLVKQTERGPTRRIQHLEDLQQLGASLLQHSNSQED